MARTGREKSSYVIHSVLNALNLLEQFIHSKGELGVTELSKRLGLHKINVFRLLATLESKGYIEQNKTTDNYRLGIKSLELGQTYIHQMGLVHHAHPIMEELAKTCKENVYLALFRPMLWFILISWKQYRLFVLLRESDSSFRFTVLPSAKCRLPLCPNQNLKN